MKVKGLLFPIVLVGLMLVVVLMGGCGETEYSSSTYYYPNWMPDGRIICWKVTSSWSEALFGRRELGTTAYIAAMNPDGSGETNIFEDSGWGGEITCSPTGELIGYIAYPDKLTIINSNGTNKRVVPNTAAGVTYFDWSPDATKIAYSANRKLYVINIDGTNNTQIATSAEGVAWRVGEKITYGFLYIINSDGTGNQYLVDGGKPQIMNSGKILYFSDLVSPGVYKIKSIYPSGTGESSEISSYERSTLKLSFDNTKIVGGDLITGGGSDIGGIWVTNINDGTSTKIR